MLPATSAGVGSCPDGMSYDQAQTTASESDTGTSPLTVFVSEFDPLRAGRRCAAAEALSNGSDARSSGSDQNVSPVGGLGQDILLKKCARKAVAPCVQSVVVNGTTVGTTMILPVNESITLTVGPQQATIKRLSPKKGAPGSDLTSRGPISPR